MALVASSIPHSVRQASFSESSNDLRGGSTYATVYTLPQNPIAIKTEIDEIANRRNEIKSSLVANLHNEDMVSHKGDSESERLQQSAGNEPCRQSEAKAQNRGSNLKPCLQSEDEGCLQSGDKLYIDTNINPKVSIDRSAAHPSDDEGPSDWKVTEGMTDPTQRDDGESDRDANRRDALDAVPDGTYDPLPTVADGYTLSNSEFEAFNHLCSLSIKTVRGAVRNEAAKQYAKRLGEGYSPATIEKAYIDYAEAYRQNNPSPRFAKQLSDWFVKSDGFAYFAKKPVIRTTTATKATTLADAVVATNRFRELDARFKSHDGMDLDPSTPEIESGYEFNRRSIEDDRAADDRNSISDQDIDSRL